MFSLNSGHFEKLYFIFAFTVEVMSGQERVKVARNRARTKSLTQNTPIVNSEHQMQNSNAGPRTVSVEIGSDSSRLQTDPAENAAELMEVTPLDDDHLRGPTVYKGSVNPTQNGSRVKNGTFSDEDVRNELRSFLRDKFVKHHLMSLTELRHHVMMRLAESPPGDLLGEGMSDAMLEQCAVDVGAALLQIPVS